MMAIPQISRVRRAHWTAWLATFCLLLGLNANAQSVSLRAAVAKPLQAAQEALKNNQAQQAMALAKEALAVPQLSAAELVSVQRTLAVAALNAKDPAQASESLMVLLAQPDVSPADQRAFLESLTQARQQLQDPAGVVKSTRQYLALGGNKPGMRVALLQSLSAQKLNDEVIAQVQAWLKQGEKTVAESELRLLALSYRQIKDAAGYEATLLRLLERFPAKAYWSEAITRLAHKPNGNPRLELDMYRLLEDTENLEDAAEYTEMIELALKAGLPAEAQRVLDAGFQKGVLGQGSEAGAHQKLRQQVKAKLSEDEKLLETLERTASDGNSWAAVGDVRLSQQQWAQARDAYAKAQAAGGLRRLEEVLLHQAMALCKLGQAEQCRTMLASIKDDATALALANLWRIRSLHPR